MRRIWKGSSRGTELSLSPLQLHYSSRYRCKALMRFSLSLSIAVIVTVHVPVANATINPGSLSHQVHTGDPVTLHCSVQVGSAPVTFTWLHNGQEVAWGPLLELGDVDVGHSGTYQCVATNQLGQDGHCMFQALSPKLALEVTPQGHWNRGAQTTQLLVEPPWTPAVLWDRVTLTCQGLGTAGATTWYKDGEHWRNEFRDKFVVTERGTYRCDRPGTTLSPPVRVLNGEGLWVSPTCNL
ncbi:hypothetical protein HGM15179_019932 [Zosterops borbonicus]|uniref:Ig-like domain-containing protein n=1 Tax=Zosterops borbonicus TaxID=364589 RepID=A0A8K1DAK6_9PASS|nr:hypothetical protein HGM15179_019932 [Zosterops borbonicus]